MSDSLRRNLYLCLLGLTVSGVLYAVPRYADLYLELDWPALVSPGLLMRVHGAFSFWSLLLLGIVWHAHVRLRLRRSPNRATGVILCAGMVVLVISGYLLYYVGSVEAREVSGVVHTVCGLAVPAVLAWHVWQGAKLRLRARGR